MTYYLTANLVLWLIGAVVAAKQSTLLPYFVTPRMRDHRVVLRLVMALWTALLLTACGGGGDTGAVPEPEDGHKPPPTLNCEIRPEVCK